MKSRTFDPIEESEALYKYSLYKTRSFMVSIEDKNGNCLFRPSMISNLSIDKNKIFITLYDMVVKDCIEGILDRWSKGFLWFKKKVNIILYRLDETNTEIYRVKYGECKLKNYHGKNFNYKGSELHQWYLEFSFGSKTIIQDAKDKIRPSTESVKKEINVLNNSNKMLDDAIDTVRKSKRVNRQTKEKSIQLINRAKSENNTTKEKYMHFNGVEVPLSGDYLKTIENDIVNKISDLEIN